MTYYFDLSKPEVRDDWENRIVYKYGSRADYDWVEEFEKAIRGSVHVGVEPTVKIDVCAFNDELWFSNTTIDDICANAEFIYACARYASHQAAFLEAERERRRANREKRTREFYEQFAKIPSPPE